MLSGGKDFLRWTVPVFLGLPCDICISIQSSVQSLSKRTMWGINAVAALGAAFLTVGVEAGALSQAHRGYGYINYTTITGKWRNMNKCEDRETDIITRLLSPRRAVHQLDHL